MSTKDKTREDPPNAAMEPLSVKQLAEILVKHYGIHKGIYDIAVEFQMGTGAVGPTKDSVVPGIMLGVSRIVLIDGSLDSPTSVDAALVNPNKPPRKPR